MSRKHASDIAERLRMTVLVGDGAMGTQLYSRGVPLEANFEHLNLVRPELVRQVHADYVAAGARLIETNTFGANAIRLGAIGLSHRVAAINRAGAVLAREAAGEDVLVAGSVGPLSRRRGDAAHISDAEKRDIFVEQMEALAAAGVDLFLLETFAVLAELEIALEAAAGCGLPCIAQFALHEGGRTSDGIAAEDAVRRLEAAGAAMVGANCGAGPRELLEVLRRMARATTLPLSAFPNSGFPEYVDGRHIYLSTPEYFASRAREMVAIGATLVGGCCGTGPDHIRALAAELSGAVPVTHREVEQVAAGTGAGEPSAARPQGDWLQADPVPVTVELDPPRGLDCEKVIKGARALKDAGVSAINLAENPLARVRMGNIALASRIQDETGLPVIVHVTGRDRNLIGLHSELMGAHLLGIRNLLAVTGDPVSVSADAGASSVFDVNSIGLLELMTSLNQGRTLYGQETGEPARFLLGAAFNPNVRSLDGQLLKLEKKIAAGAAFVQTQPVYSPEVLEAMLLRTGNMEIPVLLGILPLVSERNAEFLHNEVPGIELPDDVRQRMRGKSGESGVAEGMAIARDMIDAGRGRVAGFYLIPPFGKVELARELLNYIRSG